MQSHKQGRRQFSADQLTLYRPGGTHYPHPVLPAPPGQKIQKNRPRCSWRWSFIFKSVKKMTVLGACLVGVHLVVQSKGPTTARATGPQTVIQPSKVTQSVPRSLPNVVVMQKLTFLKNIKWQRPQNYMFMRLRLAM